MKIPVAVAVLMIVSASCSRGNREGGRQIVLPNPDLLRTCPAKGPQLWRDLRSGGGEIYPAKFWIDLAKGGCSYGFMVWYDKSVSMEEVRTAINQHYGKWEKTDFARPDSKMRLWRIEPERFVIQLTQVGEDEKGQNPGEPGMTQVIYLPMTDRPIKFSEDLEYLGREYRTAFKGLCDCR